MGMAGLPRSRIKDLTVLVVLGPLIRKRFAVHHRAGED